MSDQVQFRYVGGTATKATTKIDWPERVTASIVATWLKGGSSAKDNFANHLVMLNEARVEAGKEPIDSLPESYTNNNAGSLLHGMRTRFLKRINKGNAEARQAAEEFGIIEPASQD